MESPTYCETKLCDCISCIRFLSFPCRADRTMLTLCETQSTRGAMGRHNTVCVPQLCPLLPGCLSSEPKLWTAPLGDAQQARSLQRPMLSMSFPVAEGAPLCLGKPHTPATVPSSGLLRSFLEASFCGSTCPVKHNSPVA